MFTKQISIIIILTLIIASPASGQGEFLRPGENGFGIYGGLVSSEDSDASSFGLGYSLKGRVDFSFAVTSHNDVDVRSYALGATYYVKHSHRQGMFGMGIMLGYGSQQADRFRDFNAFILGAVVFNNFYLNSDFMLQPYLSGNVWRNSNASVGSGQFGINAGLAHRAQARPFIGVAIGSSDGQGYKTISGGLVAVF